ncbi:hypothetical protein [Terriglobus sp. TAA 43]|uniref:hypothetical protein n=1 Tax=Terriglobus sp. TAA 43 TaxID=278961 RepID=UPI00064749F9|nr:hypothetical protein [Terriglobus sp. TAA 43]
MADDFQPQRVQIEVVPAKPGGPKSLSEHPLVITLASFVLTGLIGSFISYQIQSRNAEADRFAKDYQASTTSIASFSDAIYVRYVRANFLISALKRHAPVDEVLSRKKLYDESVVAQEGTLLGKELLIREALQQPQYSSFETLYDSRASPRFHSLDRLITAASDSYVTNPKAAIEFSQIDQTYTDTRNCSYALINLVFLDVSTKQYLGKGDKAIGSGVEARQDFDAQCPAM